MKLNDVYELYPSREKCIAFLEDIIWPKKIYCPYCKSENISNQKNENRHHCNSCNSSFSVTVGTIFHKTKVDLQKWFYLIRKLDSGILTISLRELGVDLNVTKDTAWKMHHSLKRGKIESPELLNSIINHLNISYGQKIRS